KSKRLEAEEKSEDKRIKTLERELEWIRMSPKARHAKSKSRITAYEKLAGQTAESMSRDLQIFIPPGPRLGEIVVDAKGISKAYGDKLLFSDLDFRIPPGAVVGVIGANGAGKSTLFRLILGQEKVDSGAIVLGETVKIASMDQSRYSLPEDKTVWEAVSNGLDSIAIGNATVNSRAYVARFNFSGSDQQKPVSALSGGERNRLQMALMLKDESNLLLLDEPTNDLDVNTLRALEEAIERYAGSVIVTSHDRWFLDRLATHILAFEGNSEVRWFDGNFTEYEEDRIKRLGEEAKTPKRVRFARIKRD
ncbi:MAG: ATP-binding cassette domain-containing protein, partial [bacterium]|nr:ATP-binding cassette domain-containing protein [bacterium]